MESCINHKHKQTLKQNYNIVCNKHDVILKTNKETKNYIIDFEVNKKFTLEEVANLKFYEIMQKTNNKLIERIEILEEVSDNEIHILFIFKEIATSVGIPRKYMLIKILKQKTNNLLMYTSKNLDFDIDIKANNANKTNTGAYLLSKIDLAKYDVEPTDRINCRLANLTIIPLNNKLRFNYEFNLSIHEDLPMYMEHLMGLLVKKIMYNLKLHLESDEVVLS
jgi:hypothetical protein